MARTERDPICGKTLVVAIGDEDTPRAEYKKRVYHFCSDGCRDGFVKHTGFLRVLEAAQGGRLFRSPADGKKLAPLH